MAALIDVIRFLRFARHLGLRLAAESMLFAFSRDRSEAHTRDQVSDGWMGPGPASPNPDSQQPFRLSFGQLALMIEFMDSDMIRVTWSPGREPPTYALTDPAHGALPIEPRRKGSGWDLRGEQLNVHISEAGGVNIRQPDGRLLRSDQPPAYRGEAWSLVTSLAPSEHLFGLGERAGGPSLRPGTYRLWNSDPAWSYGPGDDPLYLTIPVMMHVGNQASYLVFFENPHDGLVELADACRVQFDGGSLRYYVIAGPPAHALTRFCDLTGRPPMPPRWALGFHQSRWGYRSADDIRAVATYFNERGLPLRAIHMDIDYMQEYRVFSVNPDGFPDLRALAEELGEIGIRLVSILNPGIKWDSRYQVFNQASAKGLLCSSAEGGVTRGVVWPGWVGFPDFTAKATRAWWGDQYRRLLDLGISGFWHDMNEPVSFAAWGDTTLPLSTRHEFDGSPGDHRMGHNLYGQQMNRAGYEGLRRLRPDRRPWILSRSGWAGNQRYAWNWTGDTQSSWEALRMTIATVIGLSMSGIYYSGPDVGGFSGSPSPELFLRWLQLSCLLPFFRVHSSINSEPREPWAFDQGTQAIIGKYLHLRSKLIPYLYTLAARASRFGEPLVRPAFWPEPHDHDLLAVDDTFFLGDSLLVAPILDKAARSRRVRLPAGEWISFWTGEIHHGADVMDAKAPLDTIPIFVRCGTVLPLWNGAGHTLRLYPPQRPGEECASSLYQDDGDGYGPSRWDHFHLRRAGEQLVLTHSGVGDYRPTVSNFEIEIACSEPADTSQLDGPARARGTLEIGFQNAGFTISQQVDS